MCTQDFNRSWPYANEQGTWGDREKKEMGVIVIKSTRYRFTLLLTSNMNMDPGYKKKGG